MQLRRPRMSALHRIFVVVYLSVVVYLPVFVYLSVGDLVKTFPARTKHRVYRGFSQNVPSP